MYEDSFMTAREFLGMVREDAQRIEVLEKRIEFRNELCEATADLEAELGTVEQEKLHHQRCDDCYLPAAQGGSADCDDEAV